jgi:electron transfer flavoprotein beta subunit
MKAKKKPFSRISPASLGLSEELLAPYTERSALAPPPPRQAGRLIEGEVAFQASELVRALREEAKLI